ncbi:ornithine cyclodeaminase family protein [Corynebacterium spheniscorum]|uniref:Ornithine cyclodeaminase n=1 Tax=Corynebacterium spheniscorum TaxID=185761 RepID=A0A1I2QG40_9CORY|nr:ornithine cyclodeaminase family protein [Corynebacterium spheniscorum]KAA8719511.1 ornithine cyclodeaminase family protein [Corynebacterium spheniscorum]SFG27372.1 ornithine cyclodeaminase [Corynebacterium spheniscorum]
MSTPNTLRYLGADDVLELSPMAAVEELRQALIEGFDPAADAERSAMSLPGGGEMLMMPSRTQHVAGIKVLTVAPAGFELDVPRIQGMYLLFDAKTFSPSALIDGAALTSVRTPAVSIAGIKDLIVDAALPLKTVIFGTGPQGRVHASTLQAVLEGIREVEISMISRTKPEGKIFGTWYEAGSTQAQQVVKEAELIMCCTTSAQPLIDAQDIGPHPIIVAVGSHTPEARELGGKLMAEAQVIVEDHGVGLRECGDVIQAIEEGHLKEEELLTIREVVCGEVELDRQRPIVFKTAGQPWEDLVIASAVTKKS